MESDNQLVTLEGEVERIVYSGEETGFTVAVVNIGGSTEMLAEIVTIIGKMPDLTAKVDLKATGYWGMNKRFGRQFTVQEYKLIIPTSKEGIVKYLGSGLIKGIGPATAQKIVDIFGEDTFAILEGNIDRLVEVKGISPAKLEEIKLHWGEQKEFKDLVIFLQKCHIGTAYVRKIYKLYGVDAISTISANPYRLASDIIGIGFKKADLAALKLGVAKDSPERLKAGIIFTLQELARDGHTCYPYTPLLNEAVKILSINQKLVTQALDNLIADMDLISEDFVDIEKEKLLFLPKMHQAETGIADMISELSTAKRTVFNIADVESEIEEIQENIIIKLSDKQNIAVATAIKEKVSIITGGPGTGKTTLVNTIIRFAENQGIKVLLAAPTGRAAKRLSESTKMPAKTIHRLLKYSIRDSKFLKGPDNPLSANLIILDEVSMIDTLLFYSFLKAVPAHAQLVIVGDVNQLPSVGAGNILRDLINSEKIKVIELTEIFRQEKESLIIENSHRINNGETPLLPRPKDEELLDFYMIEKEDPHDILNLIKELYQSRITKRFGMNMIEDIQILTPTNKGVLGTERLNQEIQAMINISEEKLEKGGREYRLGDKVMQTKNNYDKDVFNGDIGFIAQVDTIDKKVLVDFEKRIVAYDFRDLDELVLAYAISVHKSQGSEYKAIILPVVTSHYIMLQRNLLYTAVSRAKQLVVLLGSKKALNIAIKNDKIKTRHSSLLQRLKLI